MSEYENTRANTRAHGRVAVDAFVKVESGGGEYIFRTRDLSLSGLFLYTRVGHMYPFKVGSTLTIELYDYDKSVNFKAVVVRIVQEGTAEAESYPTGFGVKIVEVDEPNRQRFQTMLDRITRDGGVY